MKLLTINGRNCFKFAPLPVSLCVIYFMLCLVFYLESAIQFWIWSLKIQKYSSFYIHSRWGGDLFQTKPSSKQSKLNSWKTTNRQRVNGYLVKLREFSFRSSCLLSEQLNVVAPLNYLWRNIKEKEKKWWGFIEEVNLPPSRSTRISRPSSLVWMEMCLSVCGREEFSLYQVRKHLSVKL